MTALHYEQHQPPPFLAHLVQCLWSLEGDSRSATPEPAVSDGSVEIILNGGSTMIERRPDAGAGWAQPACAVVGPTTQPIFLSPGGPIRIFGVRLWPWAARAVLGVPASELRDRTVAMDDVGPFAAGILDRVEWGAPSRMRVPTIAAWLAGIRDRRPHHAVHATAARIAAGALQLSSLATATGMSWRHVERLFAAEVGLSPKELVRLKRVQDAIALMRTDPSLTWSQVAMRAGYFDQPHLVREFKALTGSSPSSFPLASGGITESVLPDPGAVVRADA